MAQRDFTDGTFIGRIRLYGMEGHGSVRYLTDTNGAVTDTYDYDAFGSLISSTGSTPNNYLFAGEQFDPALGIYYNRARYYDQRQGRFWTMDTWEGSRFEPKTLHRYTYVSANPVNWADPTGHEEASVAVQAVTVSDLITLSLLTVVTLEYECLAFAQVENVGPSQIEMTPRSKDGCEFSSSSEMTLRLHARQYC